MMTFFFLFVFLDIVTHLEVKDHLLLLACSPAEGLLPEQRGSDRPRTWTRLAGWMTTLIADVTDNKEDEAAYRVRGRSPGTKTPPDGGGPYVKCGNARLVREKGARAAQGDYNKNVIIFTIIILNLEKKRKKKRSVY